MKWIVYRVLCKFQLGLQFLLCTPLIVHSSGSGLSVLTSLSGSLVYLFSLSGSCDTVLKALQYYISSQLKWCCGKMVPFSFLWCFLSECFCGSVWVWFSIVGIVFCTFLFCFETAMTVLLMAVLCLIAYSLSLHSLLLSFFSSLIHFISFFPLCQVFQESSFFFQPFGIVITR